jgi:hypothetical protein
MSRDLAVVIITWNVRDLALQALDSLYADLVTSGLSADVYVVDNASTDGTAAAIQASYSEVRLTASAENLGFVRGNNLALRQIGFCEGADPETLPRAVYLLNPDTITQPDATRTLFEALFSASDVGLVGARLTYGDGSFQHSAFTFPGLRQLWTEFFPTPGRFLEGRFNGRYSRSVYQSDHPFAVDFVLGATMMLRREAVLQTGLMDEQFFMYCEEIDWARRIHNAGWSVRCVPKAHVIHLGGQSSSQIRPQTVTRLWTSRLLLYQKHYPTWKVALARQMIILGMRRKITEAYQSALSDTDRDSLIAAYQTVLQLAQKS